MVKQLTPEQKDILLREGTEPPGSSHLNNEKREGDYLCAACGTKLFESKSKYESGSGWPSFFEALPGVFETKIDNIIGVKDATNDLFRPLLTQTKIKKDFCYLSGEDGTALAYLAQGGHGCISVTANIAPAICSQLHNYWVDQNIDKVQEINLQLAKLNYGLFIESSPGPVKYAASLIGLCNSDTRLPLVDIKQDTKNIISGCLKDLSLI